MSTTVAPVLFEEADLMAEPVSDGVRAAVARAEWFVTDYFTIFGASGLDDYVVETELFSGYRTGYYDVLIELYDEFDALVASYGPLDTSALSLLPLEDQQKDGGLVTSPPDFIVSHSHGGGGSTSLLVLALLALVLTTRMTARRISAVPQGPGSIALP